MPIEIGIIGLPNVGKSTLFNALSAAGAEAQNFPFCTIEPNVGVVPVPDPRLELLQRAFGSQRRVPTTLEFVDIAGLVKGASRGEGLGNQFLAQIREVDAIAHVVRCFADENVTHVCGSVDPLRDIEIVETELCLRDSESLTKRHERTEKQTKAAGKAGAEAKAEIEVISRLAAHLDAGRPLRKVKLDEAEAALAKTLALLTPKPVFYVANIAEEDIADPSGVEQVTRLKELAAAEGARTVAIACAIEAEVSQLPAGEQQEFLESLGLAESGLERIVHTAYTLLDLVTFLTANANESHAWTVRRGATAIEAAGTIHTDFARGFIRAEVLPFAALEALGSEAAVRQAGRMRSEGREYVVQDGDVILFRFNL